MKPKQLLVVFFSILCTVVVFSSVAGFLIRIQINSNRNMYYSQLNENWAMYLNGEYYDNIDTNAFDFSERLHKGDTIILENTLPEKMVSSCSMRFLIYLSTIDVYVNNRLIYSYGNIDALKGKFVGSGYHFIRIPDSSAGESIRIVLHPTEDDAFTNIPSIELVSTNYVYSNFFQKNVITVFAGIFLFILGFALTISSFVATLFKKAYRGLMHIGFFSLFIGFWSLANSKVMQLYSMDYGRNSELEYLSLYAALPTIIALIIFMRSSTVDRWKRIVLIVDYGVTLAFTAATTLLHFTNLLHFPKTVTIFHVLAILSMIIIIIAGWKPFKLLSLSERIMNMDMGIILIFGLLDVVRFNVQKYAFPGVIFLQTSFLPLGTAIFIAILLVSYLVFLYNEAFGINEKQILSRMAYRDQLTGMYNRAQSDVIFKELDTHPEIPYTVINLDLNGLKKTNDTFGHAAGDDLIQRFSSILDNCFSKMGYVIRMGGDEFVVVIENPNEKMIEFAIRQMEEQESKVSMGLDYKIEASYGLAKSTELFKPIAERVYAMADERMYEMKGNSKR